VAEILNEFIKDHIVGVSDSRKAVPGLFHASATKWERSGEDAIGPIGPEICYIEKNHRA